jgi:predicted Zn-ribbon and HTH transcriptional regulator
MVINSPEMVICPVCEKVGWTDERKKVGTGFPCFSCKNEYLILIQL